MTKIKETFDDSVYLWLYTNGVLGSKDKFRKLRDAGLDEVRFNIAATDYSLDAVEQAVGIIPTVSIEIPAIPEEEKRLALLLPRIDRLGVQFLNLHELRLTPHNGPELKKRNYTYSQNTKPTVIESEDSALHLLRGAAESVYSLSVQYCSFRYKHHFQNRGARMRAAEKIVRPEESITENGYIRGIKGAPPDKITVTYSTAWLNDTVSCRYRYREVPLNETRHVIVERSEIASSHHLLREYESPHFVDR